MVLGTLRCSYFRRAFGWCVPIGALAGLIGLGGGEFRLPVLMNSVGFSAKSAVPVNLAVSPVTLAFALGTRSRVVSLADVVPHGAEVIGLTCGGMVTAFYGPRIVQELTGARLVQIIALLLAAIGSLLCIEALSPLSRTGLVSADPAMGFVIGCTIGSGIGLVSSLLGVAGGELLIPPSSSFLAWISERQARPAFLFRSVPLGSDSGATGASVRFRAGEASSG
jgi:uncharacterized protein